MRFWHWFRCSIQPITKCFCSFFLFMLKILFNIIDIFLYCSSGVKYCINNVWFCILDGEPSWNTNDRSECAVENGCLFSIRKYCHAYVIFSSRNECKKKYQTLQVNYVSGKCLFGNIIQQLWYFCTHPITVFGSYAQFFERKLKKEMFCCHWMNLMFSLLNGIKTWILNIYKQSYRVF